MDDTEKSNDSTEDDQYIEKDLMAEPSYILHQYDVGIVHQTNGAVANWTDYIFTLLGPPPKA